MIPLEYTAFTNVESGSEIDDTEIGCGAREDACDCSRSIDSLRGTAVQPKSSIAESTIVVVES